MKNRKPFIILSMKKNKIKILWLWCPSSNDAGENITGSSHCSCERHVACDVQ